MCIGVKRLRCQCEGCGECTNCLDMKKFGGLGRKQQRCSRRNKNSEGATHTNIHAIHALIVEQSLALMHSCRPWWDTCNDATLVQMIVMNYGMKSLTLCSFTSHRMWKPQTVLSYLKTHLFSPFKLNGRRSYSRSFPAQSYALTPHMAPTHTSSNSSPALYLTILGKVCDQLVIAKQHYTYLN